MIKWLLIVLILVMFPLVSGVQVDTNITLRAGCVGQSGNLCTDTARWTVISPSGLTLYNDSLGEVTAYGINNFTLWLNTTGNYFVQANFSNHNITREYNIIVEDYTTQTQTNTFEVVNLTGIYIILAMIIFLFAYLSMRMSDKHAVIRWFFALVSILFVVLSLGIARVDNTGSTIETLLDTAFFVSIAIMSVVFLYASYYILWEMLMYIANRLPDEKQPDWYKKRKGDE